MRAVVPRRQRPAVERDALDHVVAALLEDRDAGVDVRHAVERRQVLRGEVLAEDRGAEEEVHEAPVRDAEDALVLDAGLQPLAHALDAGHDGGERLGAGLGVVRRRVQHPGDVPRALVVRGRRAIRVGLPHLEEVLVGGEAEAEDLADRLGGLLRAAERARQDRLDPLAAQPLAQSAGLLPAALGQPVGVLRVRLQAPVGHVLDRLAVAGEVDDHRMSRRNSSCTRDSPAISGWNEITSMLSWRAATGWPSTEARISTPSPYSASHGARMNTARTAPSIPGISRSSSKERIWRPNALRSQSVSMQPRCARSSMIMPAHVPSTGRPEPTKSRSGSPSPSRAIPSVIVVDSPPGITSPSRPSRSAGTRTSRTSAPRSRSILECAWKSPWSARTPTSGI